jgi:predicted nucleic acid-binding protein
MTDAYLAALARELDLKLVTFDTGLQEAHRDVAVAIRT